MKNSAPPQVISRAGGLQFKPTYGTSITADPRAEDIMATINAALAIYSNTYSDSVTILIKFENVKTGLGSSFTSGFGVDYSDYRKALAAKATSADDILALSKLPDTKDNPVNNKTQLRVTSALARVLGLPGGELAAGDFDSTVSLNIDSMNILDSDKDRSKYSLSATTLHEVDEVLGLGSGLDNGANGMIGAEDLFRYDKQGARSYTIEPSAVAFFSIDGPTGLAQMNQNKSGDFGDWYSGTGVTNPPQVQDAFGSSGGPKESFVVELRALDVVGYTRISTAPPADQPPMISSAATCSPNPTFAGTTATFTVGATNPSGNTALAYAWDFGDGTTGQGEVVMKTYSTAGTFTVKVAVSNGTGTTTSSVDVVVDAGLNVSADEKQKFTLNFKTNKDSFDIIIDNTAFTNIADNSKIKFSIGDVNTIYDEALVEKDKATGTLGKFMLETTKGKVRYTTKNASLQALLAPFGATNDTITQTVMIPVFITINAEVYGGTYSFNYTAVQNKSGLGK